MKNILITGATGNIGSEVIRFLFQMKTSHKIRAGVRNIEIAKETFKAYPDLGYVEFDFENSATFEKSLQGVDTVFLLRPPHISEVDKYFRPLIEKMEGNNISDIVFLSVQGVEKSKVIPHNKIERLIKEFDLNYIFLRPSYFMQNLTTTLLKDIQTKREIILPAGEAKFNWVDIENIGESGAILLDKFDKHRKKAFEITGLENKSFFEVTDLINEVIKNPIRYRNVNPIKFYRIKKRDGMPAGMIMVMMVLHFLPRFQKEPEITDFYEPLTGKKPTDLKSFIEREKEKLDVDYGIYH